MTWSRLFMHDCIVRLYIVLLCLNPYRKLGSNDRNILLFSPILSASYLVEITFHKLSYNFFFRTDLSILIPRRSWLVAFATSPRSRIAPSRCPRPTSWAAWMESTSTECASTRATRRTAKTWWRGAAERVVGVAKRHVRMGARVWTNGGAHGVNATRSPLGHLARKAMMVSTWFQ